MVPFWMACILRMAGLAGMVIHWRRIGSFFVITHETKAPPDSPLDVVFRGSLIAGSDKLIEKTNIY
jgi:hypothetical protein